MQVQSLDFPCLPWGMPMSSVLKMLSFYLIISSTQPLLWASLQDKQSTMNERFFFSPPSSSQQIRTFFALTRLFLPLWQEPQDHTCGTNQRKIRNMHRRAELYCTQAALGLFTESHGCRGGGLVLVKNSFLFWNCNTRVHSSLGHPLHRETAELVLPCLRQRDAGHNPPPLHC